MESDPSKRVAIFLHSGDYDRIHQGCAIAAAAAAAGRDTQVFLFWWALDRFLKGGFEEPDFSGAPATPETLEKLEDFFEGGGPTAAQLLEMARGTGRCFLFACSASGPMVGHRQDRVAERVDQVVGWSTILAMTAGVSDRFYL